MRSTPNAGRKIVGLWATLLVALLVSVRRSPLLTGAPPRGEGFEALIGAPVVAFIPLFAVAALALVLTLRWSKSRAA